MEKSKWRWLQLFAGEGAGASGGEGGGDGAATGVDGVAAEHQRLLELGVPEEKLRKRAKRANAQLPEGAVRTAPKQAQEQPAQEQAAPAEETHTEEENAEKTPARMSWEEIMKDPEYNKQMQATVQQRLKTAKAAEENLAKLAPALELLAKRHGLDARSMDYEALAKAIDNDDIYYEDMALKEGKTLEETKRDDQQARADVIRQRRVETLEQQSMREHIDSVKKQSEALKKVFPNFNLDEEMKNEAFVRMTAPGKGLMSVEDAYYAVHRKEIEAARAQALVQHTAQNISNAIQAGARRPDENGTSGQSASVTTFDYSKASKEQREALKREIYAAKARGEKLYPGR